MTKTDAVKTQLPTLMSVSGLANRNSEQAGPILFDLISLNGTMPLRSEHSNNIRATCDGLVRSDIERANAETLLLSPV